MNGDKATPDPDDLAKRLWENKSFSELDSALNQMAMAAAKADGSPFWFLKSSSLLVALPNSLGVDERGFLLGIAFAQRWLFHEEDYAVAHARIAHGRTDDKDDLVAQMLDRAVAAIVTSAPMDEEAPK